MGGVAAAWLRGGADHLARCDRLDRPLAGPGASGQPIDLGNAVDPSRGQPDPDTGRLDGAGGVTDGNGGTEPSARHATRDPDRHATREPTGDRRRTWSADEGALITIAAMRQVIGRQIF